MKHILIIDDSLSYLTIARYVLSDSYITTTVTSGTQALNFLSHNKPNLVLLDINMPEMDGFQVMNAMRKTPNGTDIPIIFLTSVNDVKTESKCFELGASDFISKPFVPVVMRYRVDRIMELEELKDNLTNKLDETINKVSEMTNKSYKDGLTGLWNRAYTEEATNQLLLEEKRGALFMMDMDNFKAINDNYGHIVGDQTLKMFGETLQKYAGPRDLVCRIGGDEFVTYIADSPSKSSLKKRAANIINDICNKLKECNIETNSSVSIGIAQYPNDGKNFNELYNAADKALYHIKQNGKNSYHFFSDQALIESARNATNMDIEQLREMMVRHDSGKGPYLMNYDNFHHIYNVIRRIVERSKRDVQTLLFTIETDSDKIDPAELSFVNEVLERAISASLRRTDISTKYSNKQSIVILLDCDMDNGKIVAQRIIDYFHKTCPHNFHLKYHIVKMDI